MVSAQAVTASAAAAAVTEAVERRVGDRDAVVGVRWCWSLRCRTALSWRWWTLAEQGLGRPGSLCASTREMIVRSHLAIPFLCFPDAARARRTWASLQLYDSLCWHCPTMEDVCVRQISAQN